MSQNLVWFLSQIPTTARRKGWTYKTSKNSTSWLELLVLCACLWKSLLERHKYRKPLRRVDEVPNNNLCSWLFYAQFFKNKGGWYMYIVGLWFARSKYARQTVKNPDLHQCLRKIFRSFSRKLAESPFLRYPPLFHSTWRCFFLLFSRSLMLKA